MAANPRSSEKPRRFPRIKGEVPVRVMADRGNQVLIAKGKGDDLNQGGLSVQIGKSVELKVDEKVALEFTSPMTNEPVRARGVVRNCTENRYGVEFTTRDGDAWDNTAQLKAMLEEQAKKKS